MSQKSTYQRILVGFDGSENGMRALTRGISLTKQSGGELRIVVVADIVRAAAYASATGFYQRFNDQSKENAENLASEALEIAKREGVATVYSSDEEGQPADMILTLAREYKSDLIVVGRRGIRGLTRFLMGSVSQGVIGNAKCDVLVVK